MKPNLQQTLKRNLQKILVGLFLAVLVTGASVGRAQQPAPAAPVSREEYDQLQKKYDALEKRLEQLEQAQKVAAPSAKETEEELADLQKKLKEVNEKAEAAKPGLSAFDVFGLAYVNFATRK